MTHPSADASKVLHLPSGDNILAAVNIPSVEGSNVSKQAVIMPLSHFPCCSILEAKDVADSVDEQAVSILIAGPAMSRNTEWEKQWVILQIWAAARIYKESDSYRIVIKEGRTGLSHIGSSPIRVDLRFLQSPWKPFLLLIVCRD